MQENEQFSLNFRINKEREEVGEYRKKQSVKW